MFGYLVVNPSQLSKEERRLYRSYYCGLCHALSDAYGNPGRKTLSYDLTFINIILSSVYDLPENHDQERCPIHPLGKHDYIMTEASAFCADMNILLSYYKHLDDWNDEGNASAQKKAAKLKPHVQKIEERYPRICAVIARQLAEISEYERHNVLTPDLPANSFGVLMAEIFTFRNDDKTVLLKNFGYHLGRFIYLMDACMDLKEDLKKQLYNPLVSLESGKIQEILEMVMADIVSEYDKLPVNRYKNVIENVLYSGIWTKYDMSHRERRNHEGSL